MNDFGKTFALAFYNSFLKIKLNSDKENTLILNAVFKRRCCLTYLTCVLIYSLRKCALADGFKGALSGLRQFLTTETHLGMMKNAFYFTLKALLVLKVFKFLS